MNGWSIFIGFVTTFLGASMFDIGIRYAWIIGAVFAVIHDFTIYKDGL